MQRKAGFPAVNCNIKMPDSSMSSETGDDEWEPQQRRQQLINFGHTQWGFNNWNWVLTKQDLDFAEFMNGKYTAGVAAFVSITVKTLDIHRENVGYATSVGVTKGSAIHRARKSAVTNALRETLLSFGGNVTTDLLELIETKIEVAAPVETQENNQNNANKLPENKKVPKKDDICPNVQPSALIRPPGPPIAPVSKNVTANPPIAMAHPMPANLPPAPHRPNVPPRPPQQPLRPNSNEGTEEARAERKRRQRQAQEEFRMKQQLMKQKETDVNELEKNSNSFDNILMAIPTQDILIESTGDTKDGKRKSPAPEGSVKRRASHSNKLDVVESK